MSSWTIAHLFCNHARNNFDNGRLKHYSKLLLFTENHYTVDNVCHNRWKVVSEIWRDLTMCAYKDALKLFYNHTRYFKVTIFVVNKIDQM